MRIDIDELIEAELVDLDNRIVQRLRFLQQARSHKRMFECEIGDRERQPGSHKTLSRPGWPAFVFAFHGREQAGPRMLCRIAKHTGLRPEDLWR